MKTLLYIATSMFIDYRPEVNNIHFYTLPKVKVVPMQVVIPGLLPVPPFQPLPLIPPLPPNLFPGK